MKIKNLSDTPIDLGDGRMIGANAVRKYGLKQLTDRDQKRFERGLLEVVKEIPADAEKTQSPKADTTSGEKKQIDGGKK